MARKQTFTQAQQEIMKEVLGFLRKSKTGLPTLLDLANIRITRARIRQHFGSLAGLLEVVKSQHEAEYQRCMEIEQSLDMKTQMMDVLAEIIIELSRYPTQQEVLECSTITEAMIKHHFGSFQTFILKTKEQRKTQLTSLFSSEAFTQRAYNKLVKDIGGVDTFIISTVVSGCAAHEGALAAVDVFKKENDAELLLQPVADPARPRQGQELFFDTVLKGKPFVFADLDLNNNVSLLSVLYSAKRINPHDAAKRFVKNTSLSLIASPKQRLTPCANLSNHPGYLFSTGAITHSDYTTELYMSNGLAYEADKTHDLGAGIIKILGPNKFFFTNVTFDEESGDFVHLGKRYGGDGSVSNVSVDYIVAGDFHAKTQCPQAYKTFLACLKTFKPKEVFLHDPVTCESISPFESRRHLNRAIIAKHTESFEAEMRDFITKADQVYNSGGFAKIVVVGSNHSSFIRYWIESGRYAKDVVNMKIGLHLAQTLYDNPETDLLRAAYLFCGGTLSSSQLVFLSEVDSEKRHGVECGQHGHAAAGGKKSPNLSKLVEELGPCNVGHGHRSEIVRGGMRVGTFEGIAGDRPAFARKGANDWSNSIIVGYETGHRQLLHFCNVDWQKEVKA